VILPSKKESSVGDKQGMTYELVLVRLFYRRLNRRYQMAQSRSLNELWLIQICDFIFSKAYRRVSKNV